MPATGDDGVPFAVIALDGTPPTVDGGALVGNLPAAASATYVTQRLDVRVRRIGATFGFGPGDASGSLALLAVDDSGETPRGHCHLAVAPDRWIAGVVTAGYEVDEIARGDFENPLAQDGSTLSVDIRYEGDTATISLPDGTRRAVTDPRFGGSPEATVACWEFFKAAGAATDVRLYETWAG